MFMLLIFSGPCFAANLNGLGIEPLDIKGGARPIGMGLAYVAVCDDGNAILYNPAGTARTKGITVTVRDLGNFMVGQVYPTGSGLSIGLGLVRNLIKDPDLLGDSFEASSSVLVVSAGSKLSFISDIFGGMNFFRDIDLGVDVKYALSQTLRGAGESDRSAKGVDADLGALWKANDWIKLGVVAQDFLNDETSKIGTLDWNTGEADVVKSKTTIGLALKIIGGDRRSPVYIENNELLISTDLTMREDAPKTLMSIGAEWTYANTYILRAGAKQDPDGEATKTRTTAGAGLRFGYWGFDVAYTTDQFTDDPAYYFSLTYWPREWLVTKKPEEKGLENIAGVKKENEANPELVKIYDTRKEIVTDEDSINVKGEVLKPGTKVYINGNEAYVNNDGKFSVEVPLNTGKNLVEIVTESDGKKTRIERKVLKKSKVLTADDVKLDAKVNKEIKPLEENVGKKEDVVRTKEAEVLANELSIKEKEKAPLTEEQKKVLEIEKRRIEAQKKAIEIEKSRIAKERERLEIEKKKVEAQREAIAEKKAAIEDLATLGVIDITPDKVYQTEQNISRAELATWLVKAKGLTLPKLTKSPFPDVALGNPYAAHIKAAVDAGIMSVYPDGTFKPNDPISEKEGIDIFKRFAGK